MRNYEVKKHDTLWKIGRAHGFTVQQIADVNNLKGKQIHRIREGQNLLLPDAEAGTPDTRLSIQFRGLDHARFTPSKVKVQHDDKVVEREMDADGVLALGIFDHARGLKVWIEDLSKKFVEVLDRPILPLGEWKLSIDSRQVAAKGNLAPKKGAAASSAPAVKEATTHNARLAGGETARVQTRVEGGKPVHAVASIYTSENLRLSPGNEQYRKHILAAAAKYALTPQSLAAMLDAEAAQDKQGTWQEKSNAAKPSRAQGLAQFFEAAWMGVFEYSKSLLHERCQGESKTALLARRLEAEYAIDSAAAYAVLNLRAFSKKTGLDAQALPAEDKAKMAYLLHHEGVGGTSRILGLSGKFSDDDATDLLAQQLGSADKAQKMIERYEGDPVKAYKGWLFGYIDAKINVNNFVVKDKSDLTVQPRDIALIVRSMSRTPDPGKPAPRPKAATASAPKAPASPPAAQPAVASPTPASAAGTATGAGGNWRDPLDTCTLRSAGLASKNGAKFGMTRARGTRAHQGIDLIAVPGTTIHAVADGVVYTAPSKNPSYPYGNTLVLEVDVADLPPAQAALARRLNPGERTIGFFYAHLTEFSVPSGKPVDAGTALGTTGESGNAHGMRTVATGAHLHFEVRKRARLRSTGLSNRLDPLPFILNCTNR